MHLHRQYHRPISNAWLISIKLEAMVIMVTFLLQKKITVKELCILSRVIMLNTSRAFFKCCYSGSHLRSSHCCYPWLLTVVNYNAGRHVNWRAFRRSEGLADMGHNTIRIYLLAKLIQDAEEYSSLTKYILAYSPLKMKGGLMISPVCLCVCMSVSPTNNFRTK
jgi:hypothetical protein